MDHITALNKWPEYNFQLTNSRWKNLFFILLAQPCAIANLFHQKLFSYISIFYMVFVRFSKFNGKQMDKSCVQRHN